MIFLTAAFSFIGSNWKIVLIFLAMILLAVFLLMVRATGFHAGAVATVATVARQDKHSATIASKAKLTVSECYASGREWDVSTGTCIK